MKRRLTYLVLGVIFFIAGCGAMIPEQGRLEMAGRYGELERHMENIIKDPSTYFWAAFQITGSVQ